MGPSRRESAHQARPLRPFPWASPALMRARVNQPTAYWVGMAPTWIVASVIIGCACLSRPNLTLRRPTGHYSRRAGLERYATTIGQTQFHPAIRRLRRRVVSSGFDVDGSDPTPRGESSSSKLVRDLAGAPDAEIPMPALFVGHGSPVNAVEDMLRLRAMSSP